MRISIQLEPMRDYFSIAGRIISTPMIPPTDRDGGAVFYTTLVMAARKHAQP